MNQIMINLYCLIPIQFFFFNKLNALAILANKKKKILTTFRCKFHLDYLLHFLFYFIFLLLFLTPQQSSPSLSLSLSRLSSERRKQRLSCAYSTRRQIHLLQSSQGYEMRRTLWSPASFASCSKISCELDLGDDGSHLTCQRKVAKGGCQAVAEDDGWTRPVVVVGRLPEVVAIVRAQN